MVILKIGHVKSGKSLLKNRSAAVPLPIKNERVMVPVVVEIM